MNTATHINPRDIELSLTASRKTLELGESWEILLHIHNHSPLRLWIADISTTLTLPAEVIHPGESNVASRGAQLPTVPGPGYDTVSIPPGGKYICTWRLNEDPKALRAKSSTWDIYRWHVFFHPAVYQIQANIHFWTERPDPVNLSAPKQLEREMKFGNSGGLKELLVAELARRSQSATSGAERSPEEEGKTETDRPKERLQEIAGDKDTFGRLYEAKKSAVDVMEGSLPLTVVGNIDVAITSSAQFLAAALGGVLAFLFRESYWATQDPTVLSWADLALLPSYVLAAVLLTLLVNRITEARFPLTVKIMDFWGATAFGVLAAFAGDAVLDKILQFLK